MFFISQKIIAFFTYHLKYILIIFHDFIYIDACFLKSKSTCVKNDILSRLVNNFKKTCSVALHRASETLWPTTKPRSAICRGGVIGEVQSASLHSLFRFQAKSVEEKKRKTEGKQRADSTRVSAKRFSPFVIKRPSLSSAVANVLHRKIYSIIGCSDLTQLLVIFTATYMLARLHYW